MTAIGDDAQTLQGKMTRKTIFEKDDVASHRIGDAEGLANLRGRRTVLFGLAVGDHLLHAYFDLVRQLKTIPGEKLNAVILVRIVGRRDHHARVSSHAARKESDTRRGHGTDQLNVRAHGANTRSECGLEHVTGKTRILTDENFVPVLGMSVEYFRLRRRPAPTRPILRMSHRILQYFGNGAAELQRHF